jgi:hypothetical protein
LEAYIFTWAGKLLGHGVIDATVVAILITYGTPATVGLEPKSMENISG